jgi:DNA polymerase IIIc chi subunit
MWTYANIQFIPHATHNDPLPERQPIYITHKIENPNNSTQVIVIDQDQEFILSLFSERDANHLKQVERYIFLTSNSSQNNSENIKQLVKTSSFASSSTNIEEMKFFIQSDDGKWQDQGC